MEFDDMKAKLKLWLCEEKFVHSLNVMEMSIVLAKKYSQDIEKAKIAGLLHDCAKDMKKDELFEMCRKFNIEIDQISHIQPGLLHAKVGAEIARTQYGIDDEAILNAIRNHTTGRCCMEELDKIIFLADFAEPGRNFEGVEKIRELCFVDLDKSMLMALNIVIKHVLSKDALLHLDTVSARNGIVERLIYHRHILKPS